MVIQKQQFHPALDALEERCVLDATVQLHPDGVLFIAGTDNPDQVVITPDGNQIRVAYSETTTSGGLSTTTGQFKLFAAARVTEIEFHGFGGDDKFQNFVNRPVFAHGGAGNDLLEGGAGNDTLLGGSGDDTLLGWGGSDNLNGDPGNDYLDGGAGVDELHGGAGDDGLHGGGENSADKLWGNAGNDRFLTQKGDLIQDRRSWDAEVKFVNGTDASWSDKEIQVIDRAFAVLQKMTGNTRLLKDSLTREPILFVKENQVLIDGKPFNGANTEPRSGIDETGSYFVPPFNWVNYKIKRSAQPRIITIGEQRGSTTWDETNESINQQVIKDVFHEIGHNWDNLGEMGLGRYLHWLSLSGWTQGRPSNPSLYYLSFDEKWYYLKTAEFAPNFPTDPAYQGAEYGTTNPFEDWATVWQTYASNFMTAGPFGNSSLVSVPYQAKLDAVGTLIGILSS